MKEEKLTLSEENKLTLKELDKIITFLEKKADWCTGVYESQGSRCAKGHLRYDPRSPFRDKALFIITRLENALTEYFGDNPDGQSWLITANDNSKSLFFGQEYYSDISKDVSPKERVLTLLYILRYEMELSNLPTCLEYSQQL
jgi:hypothetical protein